MDRVIVVAIGRNVERRPLPEGDWLRYQAEVRRALHTAGVFVALEGQGQGEYEGVPESSAAWITTTGRAFDIEGLRNRLAVIAAEYGQREIALILGRNDPVLRRP